jgi:hypothetical protein
MPSPDRRLTCRVIVLALGLAGIALAQTDVATGLRREWPKTDFSRRTVELAEITSGGPPKDGIPAIDRPRFVAPSEAARWLQGDEPVIALRIAGDARAYPLQILTFHEIVNDTVGGTPVAVTFCPLCNASIVFERRAGERVLDFGTTGRLRKSDLVMYDRQTESWWQQFTGAGIVGHYAGTRLATRPAEVVAFDEFRTAYPGGKVLARDGVLAPVRQQSVSRLRPGRTEPVPVLRPGGSAPARDGTGPRRESRRRTSRLSAVGARGHAGHQRHLRRPPDRDPVAAWHALGA